MALNPFFLQGTSGEQNLLQDLINEHLTIFGLEVHYLPRAVFRTDNILQEVESSVFDDNFVLEAYLDNYEGYAPDSDIMTKFGLRLKNEIKLIVSKERFEDFIGAYLGGQNWAIDNNFITDREKYLVNRPAEGDLIWFPLGERLFEIKRVEAEKPFYQLNKTYVYELHCELYEYENEVIDTTSDLVDSSVVDEGYITTMTLASIGVDASATVSVGGTGMVRQLTLTHDGIGYNTTPTVTISPPSSGIGTATAVAITTNTGTTYSVEALKITNPGYGYINTPTVTITGGGGSGAKATATLGNNGISTFSVNPDNTGYYNTTPTVTITGGGGSGAVADAVVVDGSITSFHIVNTGIGYTESPTVTVSGVSTTGIGTFKFNELITGQSSGATARVKDTEINYNVSGGGFDTDNPNKYLKLGNVTGTFYVGETVIGAASSAVYIVKSYDDDSSGDEYDINDSIELEADSIIDFTESNPFGEY